MFNITSHQGNTNQNHNEMSFLHQLEWQKLIRRETKSVGEDVEKRERSYTLVGMRAGTATLENIMEFPQDVKNRATL